MAEAVSGEPSGFRTVRDEPVQHAVAPRHLPASYPAAHELKVVVVNTADLAWAEEHAAQVRAATQRFLQPEWDRRDRVLDRVLAHIASHPRWRLSLQTHKYIGVR